MFKCIAFSFSTILAVICSGFIPAAAEDGRSNPHGKRHYWQSRQSIVGRDGLPSYVSRTGTYSGGISAVRFKRNGIYFSAAKGGTYLPVKGRVDAVEPRIIHVNEWSANANCAYEAGVCVIRP